MVNAVDYWYQKYLREKGKKEKLKQLGQAMYDRMQYLTSDCTGITDAMNKWWHYINIEYKEE